MVGLPEDVPKKEEVSPKAQSQDARCEEAHLNPKYTFDTFVVGSNNKFAQAAALAVAESPGDTYNPLFIYGGAGLGKTHLMHSIAHFIIDHDENSKVLYVTSEEFTNELIETIRNGNNSAMTKFREKYRNIDVLLVDDIQFIIGKESTQEEFFHTFNSLHSAKKQIIISSDKPPKDMEILEERFRSRFEWGLIADITLPDYETRMAILHKKEEMDGYDINEEVIKYIANNIKSNIRELEGAINKVMAFAKLEKKEVTLELAEQALKDIISPDEKKVITPDYIISMVAEHFDVTVDDLCGNKRNAMIQFLDAATGTATTAEMLISFLPMILIIVFMVILIYLPQKRQDKKDAAMRSSIEIGDKVTTIGGIVGIVCAIADKDDTIVIETGSDRTKIRFRRTAISSVEKLDAGKDSKSTPVKK